ncbi:MAG: hypothetical protein AB8F26_01730 [Phycisphaerales bacterium]
MTTVTTKVHFGAGANGRRVLRAGSATPPSPPGRVPRVARLMALAIRFENLIAEGGVTTQAELAELGHVTRARVTQIMNLLHLAPDIQEQILDLPTVVEGRDRITERDLRRIAAEIRWDKQRHMWSSLRNERLPHPPEHTDQG